MSITLVYEPTIIPVAEMQFIPGALRRIIDSIEMTHPECYPAAFHPATLNHEDTATLTRYLAFPHGGSELGRNLTDNELLPELYGRLCYYSFGAKAGTPNNKRYIANTQRGAIPHRSLLYHPKMSFFISGVSRRLTHELMRHYVGADRSEEGSPSQESTRYVEHPGWFVLHPGIINSGAETVDYFIQTMERVYRAYTAFIAQEESDYCNTHSGTPPKGLDRKRIYEAASSFLPHSAMTSLGWTTNPAALHKLFQERLDESADLEFQRLAQMWKKICVERWPNLFQEFDR